MTASNMKSDRPAGSSSSGASPQVGHGAANQVRQGLGGQPLAVQLEALTPRYGAEPVQRSAAPANKPVQRRVHREPKAVETAPGVLDVSAPAAEPSAAEVDAPVQRHMLNNGAKVTGDEFNHVTAANAVRVLCFSSRHSILGLANNKGGMKANNTVLMVPVEMTTVAEAAYACAWNEDEGKLRVADGTTFVSEGITWDIVCRPSENSIHINPKTSPPTAIDIGMEIIGIRAYVSKRGKGDDHETAKNFVNTTLKDKVGNLATCNLCIDALVAMGDV